MCVTHRLRDGKGHRSTRRTVRTFLLQWKVYIETVQRQVKPKSGTSIVSQRREELRASPNWFLFSLLFYPCELIEGFFNCFPKWVRKSGLNYQSPVASPLFDSAAPRSSSSSHHHPPRWHCRKHFDSAFYPIGRRLLSSYCPSFSFHCRLSAKGQ